MADTHDEHVQHVSTCRRCKVKFIDEDNTENIIENSTENSLETSMNNSLEHNAEDKSENNTENNTGYNTDNAIHSIYTVISSGEKLLPFLIIMPPCLQNIS